MSWPIASAVTNDDKGADLAESRVRAMVTTTAFWVAIIDLGIFVAFGLLSRNNVFFSAQSVESMLLDLSITALLAVAMTFVLAAGMLDLSVGATMVLASVVSAKSVTAIAGSDILSPPSGIALAGVWIIGPAVAVLTGFVVGIANGFVVRLLRGNALIATLGMSGILMGIVLVWTGGQNVAGIPLTLQRDFGLADVGGILPFPMIVTAIVCIVLWVAMRSTGFGLHVLAVGSSDQAALRSGVMSGSVILRTFLITGAASGLAGFFTIARFGSTNIVVSDAALVAIAATVIGGTSLFGGVASVGGAIAGSVLPVVLGSGLIVIGVESFYQQIVVGVILIGAVLVDQERRARKER